MKKLVTGIEAIQSGKLIRRHFDEGGVSEWFNPEKGCAYSFKELTTPCFEIKSEPREFWIYFDGAECPASISARKGGDNWIKVREVLE